MHLHVAEVAPLAPLVIDLGVILVWAVGLALCLLCVYLTKALFGTATGAIGWIPYAGKVLTRPLSSIERKIVSFMSQAAVSCDARMGAALHELARLVDWMGREIARHADQILTIAELLTGTVDPRELVRGFKAVWGGVHAIEHDLHVASRRVRAAEERIAHGIGDDVLPHLRSLDREIAHEINPELAQLRHRARELEDGALHTFRWIRAHPGALASTAFVGAVAWALARMGAGWVRCENVGKVGRRLCGLPGHLLADLLEGAIDVLIVADLCQLSKVMIAAAESAPVQDALSGLIAGIDELLLCQGVDRPPPLAGYWTAVPPLQRFAELAA